MIKYFTNIIDYATISILLTLAGNNNNNKTI